VQAVDRFVAGEYGVEQRVIAGDKSFDRRAHPFFGEAAHLEQPSLERFELLLEMPNCLFH